MRRLRKVWLILTVLVTLDLDNHLLQAVNGLVATLLRHLILEVIGSAVFACTSLVLGLVRDVLPGLVAEIAGTLASTGLGINTRVATGLLVTVCKLSGVSGVTRSTRVGSLSSVTKSALGLVLVEGLLFVVLVSGLLLQGRCRKIGNIVPCVVRSWLVNLVELVLRWVDLGSCLLGGITSHITDQNSGIAH